MNARIPVSRPVRRISRTRYAVGLALAVALACCASGCGFTSRLGGGGDDLADHGAGGELDIAAARMLR